MFDTITAISTGAINQPISIIRLSGPEAFSILKKIFTGDNIENHQKITYGFIHDNNIKVDEVLIASFVAPNTFTGEDIIEINAHGGVINTNKILKLLLANGARLALPGEFSRRAFLNGKMSLVKADDNKTRLAHFGNSDEAPLVALDNIVVEFGRRKSVVRAINNFSLNIYKGEVVGLIGESGSGKSTTGNAILGLVDRQSGNIKIKGRDLPKNSIDIKGDIQNFLINKVQMIFQDPANSLNSLKNIYKVVSEGLNNIDVKTAYKKMFIVETVTKVQKILKLKSPLKAHSSESIQVVFDEKSFASVIKIIFDDALTELNTLKNSNAHLATTYLNIRKSELSKTLAETKESVEKIKRKIVVNILESVGLGEEILRRYPLEFSGGQQQRIGIARAIALHPEIIVADEPISALDVSIQAQVINIFNDMKQKFNLTFLFIAHDLRMVEYISDRIAVMYRGNLVEIGDTKSISKNFVHPYTSALMNSIPTIDTSKKRLTSEEYIKPKDFNDSSWYQVNGADHFVFLSPTEHEMVSSGGKNE